MEIRKQRTLRADELYSNGLFSGAPNKDSWLQFSSTLCDIPATERQV
jgi:hypothetical protein